MYSWLSTFLGLYDAIPFHPVLVHKYGARFYSAVPGVLA